MRDFNRNFDDTDKTVKRLIVVASVLTVIWVLMLGTALGIGIWLAIDWMAHR